MEQYGEAMAIALRQKSRNEKDVRCCPKCGGPGEDIAFRIDETADCYRCNWVGHEDETIKEEAKWKQNSLTHD